LNYGATVAAISATQQLPRYRLSTSIVAEAKRSFQAKEEDKLLHP